MARNKNVVADHPKVEEVAQADAKVEAEDTSPVVSAECASGRSVAIALPAGLGGWKTSGPGEHGRSALSGGGVVYTSTDDEYEGEDRFTCYARDTAVEIVVHVAK